MIIGLRTLSYGWIGGASLGAVGKGGRVIYDFINPTGSQWLLSSGY